MRLCPFDSVVPLILSITPHPQHHSPRYSDPGLRSGAGLEELAEKGLAPWLSLSDSLSVPMLVLSSGWKGKEVRSWEAGWGTGGKSHLCPCFHEALFCTVPEGAGTPAFSPLRKQLSWEEGSADKKRSYMPNLINAGEASTVGLTSPETRVTTGDGGNIKIPN